MARWVLATFMAVAGIGHFVSADTFLAQFPVDAGTRGSRRGLRGDRVGFRCCLGGPSRWRVQVGWLLVAFFVAVFPGNVSQFLTQTDAFGLDSDASRAIRDCCSSPYCVAWALWCTGAWHAWRVRRRDHRPFT